MTPIALIERSRPRADMFHLEFIGEPVIEIVHQQGFTVASFYAPEHYARKLREQKRPRGSGRFEVLPSAIGDA